MATSGTAYRRVVEFLRERFPEATPEDLAETMWLAAQGVFAHVEARAIPSQNRTEAGEEGDETALPDIDESASPAREDAVAPTQSESLPTEHADVAVPSEDGTPDTKVNWPSRSGGMPLRVPGARALPGGRALSRALRP